MGNTWFVEEGFHFEVESYGVQHKFAGSAVCGRSGSCSQLGEMGGKREGMGGRLGKACHCMMASVCSGVEICSYKLFLLVILIQYSVPWF